MTEKVVNDIVQEEKDETRGGITVRTKIIDVDRDKNNLISQLPILATEMENKLRDYLIETGEVADPNEISARVVLTLEIPPTAREISSGAMSFRNIRMRCLLSTGKVSVTATLLRDSFMREALGEVKQKLSVVSVPFKDTKAVMEARIGDGAILLEFRPVSTLSSEYYVSIRTDAHKGLDTIIDGLAKCIVKELQKHLQVYDLICVFRNIAFEAAADGIAQ